MNFDSLDRLIKIIQRLPFRDARFILTEIEKDMRFNRKALDYIGRRVFRIEEVLETFSEEELKLLLDRLSSDAKAYLVHKQTSYRELLIEILGRKEYNRYEKQNLILEEEDFSSEVMENLYLLLRSGKVAYNGFSLFLCPPGCRPGKHTALGGKIFFQILNPYIKKEEGIEILIYSPELAGSSLKLSCQTTGSRFFNNENKEIIIHLNHMGVNHSTYFPDLSPGPMTIFLNVPGKGEVSRTIYIGGSEALYTLTVQSIERENDILQFRMHYRGKIPFSNGFSLLYCSRCGAPLGSTALIAEGDGVCSASFPDIDERLLHRDDFYLHHFVDSHQSITRVDVLSQKPHRIPIHVIDHRSGIPIQLNVPIEEHLSYIVQVSTSAEAFENTISYMRSGKLRFRDALFRITERKLSPLEMSVRDSELYLLTSPNKTSNIYLLSNYSESGLTGFKYNPVGMETFSDIYFVFYKYGPEEPEPFYAVHSRPVPEMSLVIDAPDCINPGDYLEINVCYQTDDESEIKISQGKHIEVHKVSGKGFIPFYSKSDMGVRVELISGENQISKEYFFQERELHFKNIFFAKKNYNYEKLEKPYVLYRSPYEMKQKILNDLFSAAIDSGEDLSVRISILVHELMKYKNPEDQDSLIHLINTNIIALLKLRNSNGFFRLFPFEEGNETTTAVIFRHFSSLRIYKSQLEILLPSLNVLMNEIDIGLNEDGKEFQSIENLTTINGKNPADSLIYSNGEISGKINHSYQNEQSIFLDMVLYCLINHLDHLEINSGIQKKTILKRNTGMKKYLEKLKILKPRLLTINKKKYKSIDSIIEKLKEKIEIIFREDSLPSSSISLSLIFLLEYLEKVNNEFEFSPEIFLKDESFLEVDNFKAISEHVLIEQVIPISGMNRAEIIFPDISLEKSRYRIGEIVALKIKKFLGSCRFHFLLPGCLETIGNQENSFQRDRFHLNWLSTDSEIFLRAIRKGRGRIIVFGEDTFHRERISYTILDILEVY